MVQIGKRCNLYAGFGSQRGHSRLRNVALGNDPSAERYDSRHGMTVAQVCNEYKVDMNSGKLNGKKASTIMSDVSRIKNHIKPKLGRYKVCAITSDQIEAFMNEQSKGSAKRVIGLVGAIFYFCRQTQVAHGQSSEHYRKAARRKAHEKACRN